jgi:hypothetical protein
MTSQFFMNGCFVPMSLLGGEPADSIDELRSDYLLSVDQPNAARA